MGLVDLVGVSRIEIAKTVCMLTNNIQYRDSGPLLCI